MECFIWRAKAGRTEASLVPGRRCEGIRGVLGCTPTLSVVGTDGNLRPADPSESTAGSVLVETGSHSRRGAAQAADRARASVRVVLGVGVRLCLEPPELLDQP